MNNFLDMRGIIDFVTACFNAGVNVPAIQSSGISGADQARRLIT